jgi:GNAT superfamily N-acetyltransferase
VTELGKVEVRGSDPGDEPRLLELFEVSFGQRRTLRDWRWRYDDAPQPADTHVLTVDGRVMGFVGLLWFDAWVDGRRALLSRGGDLMIDPEIRGTGLNTALVDPINECLARADVSCGFPGGATMRVAEKAGWAMDVAGCLPQWVRWQSGHAVHADATWIPRLAGAIGAAAFRLPSVVLARARRRRPVADVDLASFDRWASAFDDLAAASREFATAVVVRDARHIRWRWLDRPGPAWHMTVVPRPETSGIDGFVVYGARAGQGRIVDLLASDAAAMQSLVLAAIDRLSREGVDRILFELADPRSWSARVLRRCGFMRRGHGPTMTVTPRAPWMPESVRDLRTWYVTFGDTDHD